MLTIPAPIRVKLYGPSSPGPGLKIKIKFLKTDCFYKIIQHHTASHGLSRSVGIATGYGLDGLGIESQWGRDFLHMSRLALGPTQPPVPGLSRGKERPGHDADPSTPSSVVVKKE